MAYQRQPAESLLVTSKTPRLAALTAYQRGGTCDPQFHENNTTAP